MDICVRNASWEVTHLATDSRSIPVPFHSCVDVHISHCSNVFCLLLQTRLARLGNGAAHFLIWPFIWGQILIGSRCDSPLCRAKSGCWQIEKFQEQEKKISWTTALLFPLCSSPSSVKAMYCPSPGSPQHVLGWIPFLKNVELHGMKSGSHVKGIPFTLMAQSSVQCSWDLVEDQKVFCMIVSKPNRLPCWIHLKKDWCLKFLSAKVKL